MTKTQNNKWVVRAGVAIVFAVAFFVLVSFGKPANAPIRTEGAPGLEVDNVGVLLGVSPQELLPSTIPADFLWGAGKFGVFEVRAPSGKTLRVEEVVIRRVGGSDEVMPSVWVRLNRERVYAETVFEDGKMIINKFPYPSVRREAEEIVTVLDGVEHRLVDEPESSFVVEPNGVAVVELFGNIAADTVNGRVPISFCLDEVLGVLIDKEGNEERETLVETRLNKTCWGTMTITPI